jgi:hypothetical protein
VTRCVCLGKKGDEVNLEDAALLLVCATAVALMLLGVI